MTLKRLIEEKQITAYRLSKKSDVPFSTISDLINGKTKPGNIRLSHALAICNALEISPEEFAKLEMPKDDVEFKYFRSNVLHDLKRKGDVQFIKYILHSKAIDTAYKRGDLECAFYLLALLEYLVKVNGLNYPIDRYQKLRSMTLPSVLFPGSDLISFSSIEEARNRMRIELIPEFAKYNIIEESVRNAV